MNQGKNNVIVINGQRYDAKTGKPLVSSLNVQAMDGVTKKPASLAARMSANHSKTIHSKHTKSHTLKRTAVKKPQHLKSTEPGIGSQQNAIKHNKHVTSHDHDRSKRAQAAHKSSHISRYGHSPSAFGVQAKSAHVPVAHVPKHQQSNSEDLNNISEKNDDISAISKALENATSHEQPRLKKQSSFTKFANRLRIAPKLLSVGSTTLAVVLLAGFFVFQNMPNLAMRVAASRSGVQASLPSYNPSGFSMNGPIQYSPGSITLRYASNTDESRNYSVTQEKSNWNSATLLENFVATNRRPYQTYQGKGKTIYVYEASSATWVDSGVWYKIEGNSSLNSDQLLRLANSL